jgi:hypothetical protein
MIPKGSKKAIVVKTEPVTAKKNQKNAQNHGTDGDGANDSDMVGEDYENENDDGLMMVTLDGEGEDEYEGGGGHMDDDNGDD